ncbi:hypothetical protein LU686_014145 [Pseudomonas juntendi]|nr:hypothetical protein [Pseudomonas juntendi]MDM3891696.1 hypothetical protein [Pseudomonas juntendi]
MTTLPETLKSSRVARHAGLDVRQTQSEQALINLVGSAKAGMPIYGQPCTCLR